MVAGLPLGIELAWSPAQTESFGETVTDPDLTGIAIDTSSPVLVTGAT